jgi:flagellar hook assembly protein FlgD
VATVDVSIYDSSGRMVRKLEAGPAASGVRNLTWDGQDSGGRQVAPGIYFVRLVADARMRAMKPIVLLR